MSIIKREQHTPRTLEGLWGRDFFDAFLNDRVRGLMAGDGPFGAHWPSVEPPSRSAYPSGLASTQANSRFEAETSEVSRSTPQHG